MPISTINPATGVLEKSFAPYTAQEIERKLVKASHAYHVWKTVPIIKRRQYLKSVAQKIRQQSRVCAELITREMGKPISQSFAEVEKSAWVCDYYADNAVKLLKAERVKTESKKSYVRFDPLGVILAVMPWNFPNWLVFRAAAPAIMAGNVMILKHSSNVPQCALLIEELMTNTVVEENTFSTLLIEGAATDQIVSDERVAAVTVTGSEEAGRRVAELAGKHLKKTVLELGGSDPFIVLEDADIEKAAAAACKARTINTGQSCIAAKRFIVVKKVAKKFTERFADAMKSLKTGDPMDESVSIGPLARRDLVDTLDQQVARSVELGAQVVIGGRIAPGNGYYYEPTILTNVQKGMTAYSEELFGPVASIIEVKNADEAVEVANDTRFGLGASIWTRKVRLAEVLAERIDSGAVFINDIVKSDPRLPFGGVKKSGYGRELGEWGIKEFTNVKTVVVR